MQKELCDQSRTNVVVDVAAAIEERVDTLGGCVEALALDDLVPARR